MKHRYLWDIHNPDGYGNRAGRYKTQIEHNFIARHLMADHKTILDLGGGSGRFALPLMKEGYDVTVVDLSKDAIGLCKERGIANSFCMDIRQFPGREFDVVLAIELFLTTPPEQVFEIAFDKLRKDGLFVSVVSNRHSWRYRLHRLRKNRSHNYGELSLDEFTALLQKHQFRIMSIQGFNWIPLTVNSDSVLVECFAHVERTFRLDRWLSQSPWLLVACTKNSSGPFGVRRHGAAF